MRDANPHYYAYRVTWQGGRQTGLACIASLADYASGRIRKHAPTTPAKETGSRRSDRGARSPERAGDDGLSARARARHLAQARYRARSRCRGDGRRRRHPPAVGDRRCAGDRGAHAAVRCAARALYRRRPPSRSRSGARGRGARRPGRGRARLFPLRDLPPPRDDDPRLQPRRPRSQRPHARAAAGRDRGALRSRRLVLSGAARRCARVRHVPRRALVSAAAHQRARARQGPDRAACRSRCSTAT